MFEFHIRRKLFMPKEWHLALKPVQLKVKTLEYKTLRIFASKSSPPAFPLEIAGSSPQNETKTTRTIPLKGLRCIAWLSLTR